MSVPSVKVRNAIDILLVIGGMAFVALWMYGGWSSMEWRQNVAHAAVVLMFAANVPYVIDAVAGRTAPHFITWFLLGIITVLAFYKQLQDGAELSTTYPLLAAGVMNFVNCFVGIRQATFQVKPTDWACGVMAVFAIIMWRTSDEALLTVVFLTIASLLAYFPTARKAWNHPETETFRTYPRNFVRYGLITAAVFPFNLTNVLYPATWVVVNGLFALYLAARLRVKRTAAARLVPLHQ